MLARVDRIGFRQEAWLTEMMLASIPLKEARPHNYRRSLDPPFFTRSQATLGRFSGSSWDLGEGRDVGHRVEL